MVKKVPQLLQLQLQSLVVFLFMFFSQLKSMLKKHEFDTKSLYALLNSDFLSVYKDLIKLSARFGKPELTLFQIKVTLKEPYLFQYIFYIEKDIIEQIH